MAHAWLHTRPQYQQFASLIEAGTKSSRRDHIEIFPLPLTVAPTPVKDTLTALLSVIILVSATGWKNVVDKCEALHHYFASLQLPGGVNEKKTFLHCFRNCSINYTHLAAVVVAK